MLTNTFLIATNSGLSAEFSGYEDLVHKSDLSDNPQNLPVLYIGSQNAARKLQATSNPGTDNILLIPTDIMPAWTASSAAALGRTCQPTVYNGLVYTCTTAGTTGSSQPTWPTVIDSTVSDGTAVWTCTRAKHLTTEIKLSLTFAGLASATGGATLSLGNTINGGVANAKTVYIQVNNAVTTPSNSTAYPDVGIQMNGLSEFTV